MSETISSALEKLGKKPLPEHINMLGQSCAGTIRMIDMLAKALPQTKTWGVCTGPSCGAQFSILFDINANWELLRPATIADLE